MAKVNRDNIKKALDSFEADDFITAKDILKAEIRAGVNDFYKAKCELTKDLDAQFTNVEPPTGE